MVSDIMEIFPKSHGSAEEGAKELPQRSPGKLRREDDFGVAF